MTDKTAAGTAAKLPSEGTVVIGCKHPPGIIMRVFEMSEIDVPIMGGGTRKEKRSYPVDNKSIRIHGPAVSFAQAPKCDIVNGYALTRGVPAEFAKTYLEQNAKSDLIQNGLFFVAADMESARKEAASRKGVKSQLEQLNPGTKSERGKMVPADERWPKKASTAANNLSEVESEDEVAA